MAELAVAEAKAHGASVVIAQGRKTSYALGTAGYARITGTTQVWSEEGDPMPGQPRYDTAIPFYPPGLTSSSTDIKIIGGRDFIKNVIVKINGAVLDITNAVFIGQIRHGRYSRYSLAQFTYEIINGPAGHVRLRLNPEQTSFLVVRMFRGVWDLEMQLGGLEYTIIPESAVTVSPGISQGSVISAGVGSGSGSGENAQ